MTKEDSFKRARKAFSGIGDVSNVPSDTELTLKGPWNSPARHRSRQKYETTPGKMARNRIGGKRAIYA